MLRGQGPTNSTTKRLHTNTINGANLNGVVRRFCNSMRTIPASVVSFVLFKGLVANWGPLSENCGVMVRVVVNRAREPKSPNNIQICPPAYIFTWRDAFSCNNAIWQPEK